MRDLPFVGRERERELLARALASGEPFLLEAEGGMGKTSFLLRSLAPPVWNGAVLYGRYGPEAGLPYEGVESAFAALAERAAELPADSLARFHARAAALFEGRRDAVLPLFPRLGSLVGPGADRPPWRGGPVEARRIVAEVLSGLLEAWAEAAGPLALVLDDLHRADEASAALVLRWCERPPAGLRLLGAFRPSGTGTEGFRPPPRLAPYVRRLGPLDLDEVASLLEKSGAGGASRAEAAELLGATGGHPLYLVRRLEEGGPAATAGDGVDGDGGDAAGPAGKPQDLLDFIEARYRGLPEEQVLVLGAASCLGGSFDPAQLAVLTGLSEERCASALEESLGRGHLLPAEGGGCRFAHDNLAAAAERLLPPERAAGIRSRAGTLLAFAWRRTGNPAALFAAARQAGLAAGAGQYPRGGRAELIALSREAAKRARSAASFTLAWERGSAALALLEPKDWESDRAFALALLAETMELAFLAGRREELADLLAEHDARARSPEERAPGYALRIQALVADNRLAEAGRLCIAFLEVFGQKVAEDAGDLSEEDVARASRAIAGWSRSPASLPPLPDGPVSASLDVVLSGLAVVFLSLPRRYGPLTHAATLRFVRFRPEPRSALLLLAYASVECGWYARPREGLAHARLARRLLARGAADLGTKAMASLFEANAIAHWELSPSQSLAVLNSSMEWGRLGGKYEYVSLAAGNEGILLLLAGRPLADVDLRLSEAERQVREVGQARGILTIQRYRQMVRNLLSGGRGRLEELAGPHFEEKEALPELEASGDRSGLISTWTVKTLLACLALRYERAYECARAGEGAIDGMRVQLIQGLYLRGRLLAALALYPKLGAEERAREEPWIEEAFRDFEAHARIGAPGWKTRLAFYRLERERALGEPPDAVRRYRRLAAGFASSGDPFDRLFCQQRLAALLAERGDEEGAAAAWRKVLSLARSWGAAGLVRELARSLPPGSAPRAEAPSLQALIEAGRLVSWLEDQGLLLKRLVGLLLELAGADYALVRYEDRGGLLAAEGGVRGDGRRSVPRLLERPDDEGAAALRRGELLAGSDAEWVALERRGPFPAGPDGGGGLLLFIPLRRHGRSLGGALLEFPPGAEADGRGAAARDSEARVASLLLSQAAVSLENLGLQRYRESLAREREGALRAERLASLGAVAAKVAHEVNNPNHAIRLNAGVVARLADRLEDDAGTAAAIREAARSIDEASARIERLVAELKAGVGGEEAESAETLVDPAELLRSARRLGEASWSAHTDSLGVEIEEGLPRIRGDFEALRRAVMNLVENACLALRSRSEGIRLRAYREGESVVLAVEDEGRGFEPEALRRATEPFFTTRRASGGTGLGLHLVAETARRAGARLAIGSRPGSGAKVLLRFPAAELPPEAPPTGGDQGGVGSAPL